MIKLIVSENQGNQRLDRFLKKYLDKAPLSMIYRMIRKDVKVNGKRAKEDFLLSEGDEIRLFILESELSRLQSSKSHVKAKRQFGIAYEDDNLLVVNKPYGLLTHGDSHEKKNHLANQVIDYLIEKREYDPRTERTFTPSPANRLDRNTTGLVIFAKNSEALRELNRMLRERNGIRKFYLTIACGKVLGKLELRDLMIKDEQNNRVTAKDVDSEGEGKLMETIATPIEYGIVSGRTYTLLNVEIKTGRTHQIRAQLAKAGFPLLGDVKYGHASLGQTTQLLHSYKLSFENCGSGVLSYMEGKTIVAELPVGFKKISERIFEKRGNS